MKIVKTYDYLKADRSLSFQVVRFSDGMGGEEFRQRRPGSGAQKWVWNLKNVRRVLYNLPTLRTADPAEIVYVVEGEKDAGNLAAAGLIATTCAMGAGKWRQSYSKELSGRRVAIIPDNDEAGRKHAADVAAQVCEFAEVVKIIVLEGFADKGDVSDWL